MSGITVLRVASETLQIVRRLCAERMEKQDVPLNLVVVFAEVAANPGRALKEIQNCTGLRQAVMSRSVAALGQGNSSMGQGSALYQLITTL